MFVQPKLCSLWWTLDGARNWGNLCCFETSEFAEFMLKLNLVFCPTDGASDGRDHGNGVSSGSNTDCPAVLGLYWIFWNVVSIFWKYYWVICTGAFIFNDRKTSIFKVTLSSSGRMLIVPWSPTVPNSTSPSSTTSVPLYTMVPLL